ncbi:MAG: cyclic nucleotide-binding domain-containing protein [Deltaproteobacteria bacterium]|nr:cyclic nucleotide-binding domain-containing protein [Deltaproteobacteria bacterium]
MRALPKSTAQMIKKALRRSPYFRGLPEKILEEIAGLWRERSFEKGTTILRENSRARHLFVLSRGAVAVSIRRGEGELIIEIVKKKGALFGWSALVSPRRYTATAKALENCRVLSVEGKDLERFFQRYPSFGLLFLQRLSSLIANRLYSTRLLLAETLS